MCQMRREQPGEAWQSNFSFLSAFVEVFLYEYAGKKGFFFFAKLNWICPDQIKPILCLYIKYEPACLAPSEAIKVHLMAPPKLIK